MPSWWRSARSCCVARSTCCRPRVHRRRSMKSWRRIRAAMRWANRRSIRRRRAIGNCPHWPRCCRRRRRVWPQIAADQVVAIGYTSGSTGTPGANAKTWGSFHASNAGNLAMLRAVVGSASRSSPRCRRSTCTAWRCRCCCRCWASQRACRAAVLSCRRGGGAGRCAARHGCW